MSWLSRLKSLVSGSSKAGEAIAGTWRVVDISDPHPFGAYVIELREDGSLAWKAHLPTRDAGDFDISGEGTWHSDGVTLHYVSGKHAGTCSYSLEDGKLVLGGLPATKLDKGTRCVLVRDDAA
jgi:hypothetical protein